MSSYRSSGYRPSGRLAARGRHRAPRRPRGPRLLRGAVLSGVVGTVALSSGAAAPAFAADTAADIAADTRSAPAELPLVRAALTTDTSRAAEATGAYADRTALAQERARVAAEAREAAAERKARAEAQRQAAAEEAAERAAERERQEREAAEAAASRDAERTTLDDAAPAASAAPDSGGSVSGGSVSAALDFARAQLGDAYALGANGPDTWDCSSLTQAAYAAAGISLPRTSQEQSALGTEISLDQAQPGDLLYWGSRGGAYHVALYAGGNTFVGAQNSSTGVVERDLDWDPPTGAIRLS